MTALVDLSGQKYGRLTVIARSHDHGEHTAWLCRCDCGAEHWATGNNLRRGLVLSCGCLRNEANKRRAKATS